MLNNAFLGTRHKWRVPRTLTLNPTIKVIGKATVITDGNAAQNKRGSRRRHLGPYGPQITLTTGGRAAGATDYSTSSGRRYQNHPHARAAAKVSATTLKTRKRGFNKGLLGTTHKLSLCTPHRSLLDYRVQPVGRPQSPYVR